MGKTEALLEWLGSQVFGVALPLVLLSVGLVYAVALGGFPFAHPLRTLRLGLKSGKTAVRALFMALSGTLGVGNIAGVALAIAYGGAGAVFWMWVSALISTFLKYAEVALALKYREKGTEGYAGGAMYYIKKAAEGRVGRTGAFSFAILCVFAALCLGALVQSSAAAESLLGGFSLPPLYGGLLLLLLSLPVVCGGRKRLLAFTAKLIPLLSALYICLSLSAIFSHASGMGQVMRRIFSEAFRPESGVGVLAFLSSRGLRYGVSRGLLSHEAGAGTAPMAHATAENTPAAQGVLGILEVLIDTFVFCTLTAFVLLLAFPGEIPQTGGMLLMDESFLSLVGKGAPPLLSLSVFLFAYATVLSWCYYGKCAVTYLSSRRIAARGYLVLYLLFVFLGAFLSDGLVWRLTDTVLSLLTVLHALFLLPMVGEVRALTRSEGLLVPRGRRRNGEGKVVRRRREKATLLPCRGQGKGEAQGVQHRALSLLSASVQPVSQKRMPDGRHMDANLMGAPRGEK